MRKLLLSILVILTSCHNKSESDKILDGCKEYLQNQAFGLDSDIDIKELKLSGYKKIDSLWYYHLMDSIVASEIESNQYILAPEKDDIQRSLKVKKISENIRKTEKSLSQKALPKNLYWVSIHYKAQYNYNNGVKRYAVEDMNLLMNEEYKAKSEMDLMVSLAKEDPSHFLK